MKVVTLTHRSGSTGPWQAANGRPGAADDISPLETLEPIPPQRRRPQLVRYAGRPRHPRAGRLSGFAGQHWNAARLDRIKAIAYRNRLLDELRGTEAMMAASSAYYRDVHGHALATLHGLDGPAQTSAASFLVDSYQATQVFPRPGKHLTYDEALATGNAALLGPPPVRDRIVNFYAGMDALLGLVSTPQPYRQRMRSLMPYGVQAAIRGACDEIINDEASGLTVPRLPADCPLVLDAGVAARAAATIRAAPGLRYDLTGQLLDLDAKLLQFGKIAARSRQLRAYLETAPR